jgi:hypothetical protein
MSVQLTSARGVAGLIGLFVAGVVSAQVQPPVEFATPLSPRIANYTIEVDLDPGSKMLNGRQTVVWRNTQETAVEELWFHLYWNAWRNNRSTWLLEDRFRNRSDRKGDIQEEDWGYLEVLSVRQLTPPYRVAGDAAAEAETVAMDEQPAAVAELDLTTATRFASPDDGNADDRTVMVIPLPQPVEPGEAIEVELVWQAKIPRTFARTGFRGDYFFIAHWFPKLGVLEPDGWNTHQYHASTEYFSDYGIYDVTLTLPSEFVVGSTGKLIEQTENPDGTTTHRYYQEDVHAFTFTASPDYKVVESRFEEPGLPPVDLRLLIQPEHRRQADRHIDATKATLRHYGTWFGPYPYDHLTIVDPAYGSGAGGMEYPTLFTAGTRLFNPFGGGSPEGVTIHEAGHQFWYALVGNNEFEHAWLDEGLNTFSTSRTFNEAYGEELFVKRYFKPPGTDMRGFLPVMLDGIRYSGSFWQERMNGYREAATSDMQGIPTYLYFPSTGSRLSYSKTALWLATLENFLGWDTLQEILSTFFERWKFGHPAPEDFFAVADEVSDQDLGWFFDQVYWSSEEFDYAIESVVSKPVAVEGMVGQSGDLEYVEGPADDDSDGTGGPYRTEVVVRREGGGVFPVDVLMVFEDGEEVRDSWDGRYRWIKFVEERPAKLEYAVVDPDFILQLDTNRTNNSRLRESQATLPTVKWTTRWVLWLQDFLATFGFFV